jgi:DNA-directed RNA polymerase specialized sigma subunit
MARKAKSYTVDFTALEQKANNKKYLNPFEQELINHIATVGNPGSSVLSPHQLATLDLVYEAMEGLTSRQQLVLSMTFGLGEYDPMTELQIASQLSITHQGAHDIKVRAIKAIQKKLQVSAAASKTSKTPKK